MATLKEKAATGIFWGAISNLLTQVISAIIGFYLGRILVPAEYGLVAMLAIFSAIAGVLQESGFTAALTNLKEVTDKDYNAVFWFSTLVSSGLYLVLFFCAPLIADFYGQPELVPLSRLVFASFVVAGIGTAHAAYMFRNMMNKGKAIISTVASITSGVTGLVLAYNGFSYWSLAWQQFVFIVVTDLGRLYYVRWLPSLKIDFSPIRRMFGFSSSIMITALITQVNNNMLSIIFGKLFSTKSLGNFTQAFKWDSMAYTFVSGTINQVAQPVLSSINDQEERQLHVFRKLLRFTAFISFPAMFGLSLVAREFILLTVRDNWVDSIPLLRILCISGAFLPFFTLYQNMVISRGRSNINMWANVSLILLQLTIFIICSRFSILHMVVLYTVINILWIGVWQTIARRIIRLSHLAFLKDILPFMLSAAVSCAVAYLLTINFSNLWLILILRIVIVATLYFCIMKFMHAQILEDSIAFFMKKTKNK